MVYEMLLHCFEPGEWLYDPEWKSGTSWILEKYLDFDHPWFEHHERGRNTTILYNMLPGMTEAGG